MNALKKTFRTFIIIILASGILMRLICLESVPPGFHYDEGIQDMHVMFDFIEGRRKISVFELIKEPQILIVKIFNQYLKDLSIFDFFMIFRLTHALIGIIVLLLLTFLGRNLINEKYPFIIYLTYISLSEPLLIHASRVYNLAALLWFIVGTFILFKMIHALHGCHYESYDYCSLRFKITLFIYLTLGALAYMLTVIIDIKAMVYVIISLIYFLLMFVINFKTKHPFVKIIGMFSFALLSLCILRFLIGNTFIVQKLRGSMAFIPSNILLYFHPDYLFISGGSLILKTPRYIVHAGLGVLGPLGFLLYLIPFQITKVIRTEKSILLRSYLTWFMLLFLAHLISVSLTKYNNPVGIRHVYFYSFYPLALTIILRKIIERNKSLKIILILSLLAYVLFFNIYYFKYYPQNIYVQRATLANEHKILSIAAEKLVVIEKLLSSNHLYLIYVSEYNNYRFINMKMLCDLYSSYINYKISLNSVHIKCMFTNVYYLRSKGALQSYVKAILRDRNAIIGLIFENINNTLSRDVYHNMISYITKKCANVNIKFHEVIPVTLLVPKDHLIIEKAQSSIVVIYCKYNG